MRHLFRVPVTGVVSEGSVVGAGLRGCRVVVRSGTTRPATRDDCPTSPVRTAPSPTLSGRTVSDSGRPPPVCPNLSLMFRVPTGTWGVEVDTRSLNSRGTWSVYGGCVSVGLLTVESFCTFGDFFEIYRICFYLCNCFTKIVLSVFSSDICQTMST